MQATQSTNKAPDPFSFPAEPTMTNHIEIRTTRRGSEKAFIVGTRIGVDVIYISHELEGQSPDEIIQAYPHLTLSSVHAALAYYYEHSDEIRDLVREDKEFADKMEANSAATRYSGLRNASFGAKGGSGPVSS